MLVFINPHTSRHQYKNSISWAFLFFEVYLVAIHHALLTITISISGPACTCFYLMQSRNWCFNTYSEKSFSAACFDVTGLLSQYCHGQLAQGQVIRPLQNKAGVCRVTPTCFRCTLIHSKLRLFTEFLL